MDSVHPSREDMGVSEGASSHMVAEAREGSPSMTMDQEMEKQA